MREGVNSLTRSEWSTQRDIFFRVIIFSSVYSDYSALGHKKNTLSENMKNSLENFLLPMIVCIPSDDSLEKIL